jgi:hypothetical protein
MAEADEESLSVAEREFLPDAPDADDEFMPDAQALDNEPLPGMSEGDADAEPVPVINWAAQIPRGSARAHPQNEFEPTGSDRHRQVQAHEIGGSASVLRRQGSTEQSGVLHQQDSLEQGGSVLHRQGSFEQSRRLRQQNSIEQSRPEGHWLQRAPHTSVPGAMGPPSLPPHRSRIRPLGFYSPSLYRSGTSSALSLGSLDTIASSSQGAAANQLPDLGGSQVQLSSRAHSQPAEYVDQAIQTSDADIENENDEQYEAYIPTGVFRYEKWIGEGRLLDVTHLAWAQARQLYNPVPADMNRWQWICECHNILLGMPSLVLTEVAAGNLMQAFAEAKLAHGAGEAHPMWDITGEGTDWFSESKKDAPVIYLVGLCTEEGVSPTPRQFLQVVKRLRGYISMLEQDVEGILEIDNVGRANSTKQDIRQFNPFFLCKTAGPRRRIAERESKVIGFCDALERRFRDLSDVELDEPMKRPLVYIGYAFNFVKRRNQHMEGGTSFLLHLVPNTLRVRHTPKRTIGWLICSGSLSGKAISIGRSPDLFSRG